MIEYDLLMMSAKKYGMHTIGLVQFVQQLEFSIHLDLFQRNVLRTQQYLIELTSFITVLGIEALFHLTILNKQNIKVLHLILYTGDRCEIVLF